MRIEIGSAVFELDKINEVGSKIFTKTSKGDFRRTTPTKVFHTREDAMKEARSEPVTPWFIENFDTIVRK